MLAYVEVNVTTTLIHLFEAVFPWVEKPVGQEQGLATASNASHFANA